MKKPVKNKTPESASERIKRKLEGTAADARGAPSAEKKPAAKPKEKPEAPPKTGKPEADPGRPKAPPAPKVPVAADADDPSGARKIAYKMERARKAAEKEAKAPKPGLVGRVSSWIGGMLGAKDKARGAKAAQPRAQAKAKTGAGKGA